MIKIPAGRLDSTKIKEGEPDVIEILYQLGEGICTVNVEGIIQFLKLMTSKV